MILNDYDIYGGLKMDAITKRAKLNIYNHTHKNSTMLGKELKLIWKGDTDEPPKYTHSLLVGGHDYFHSRGIGNGDNYRTFEVEIYLVKKTEDVLIGKLEHPVFSPYLSTGGEAETKIYAELFDPQTVRVYCVDPDPALQPGPEIKFITLGLINLTTWGIFDSEMNEVTGIMNLNDTKRVELL